MVLKLLSFVALSVISETALGTGSGSIPGGPRFVVAVCDCRADARKRVPPKTGQGVMRTIQYASFFMTSHALHPGIFEHPATIMVLKLLSFVALSVISETALGTGSGSIPGGPRFVVAACDCRADARKRVPPKTGQGVMRTIQYASFLMDFARLASEHF